MTEVWVISILVAVAALPYGYLLVRVLTMAYFKTKLVYNRELARYLGGRTE